MTQTAISCTDERPMTTVETALTFGVIPIFIALKMYIGNVVMPAPARK